MAIDKDALNYPYIRVRDVNWLKRTLLLFPHVVRMTPESGGPPDDPEIAEFTRVEGRRGPLLRPARLWSEHVYLAQQKLIAEIRRRQNDPIFLAAYSRAGTLVAERALQQQAESLWGDRLLGQPFQLHRSKLVFELQDFLLENDFAWTPRYPHGVDYVEMHPRLGEAVMATLAFACAEGEGLDLVTEFPSIYGRTIRLAGKSILDGCLLASLPAEETTTTDMAEIIVYQRCNVNKLTPESLRALNHEWEAIGEFRDSLAKLAQSIPPNIKDHEVLRERLNDVVNDIFVKWKRDQANLSPYVRELFGDGMLTEPKKALSEVAEKIIAAAGTGVGAGTIISKIADDDLLAAGTGLAVGLIFYAIDTLRKVRRRRKTSPLRYLTMMQNHGVGFVVSV